MSPAQWGPPVWALLHTIAEKIDEKHFPEVSEPLFNIISQICKNLPCPDCSEHASQFMNKVKPHTIQTKENFKLMLFVFHNQVNKRKIKPFYEGSNLTKYASNDLRVVFIEFVKEYTRRQSNFRLMADTSARQKIAKNVGEWLSQNYQMFCIKPS